MQLCDLFLKLGQDGFGQLVRSVSIGKLKTFQLYEGFKASAHLIKVNTESLRKSTPRFWSRIEQREEDFARDLGQAVLVSQLEMIVAVLDFIGIPHENGFFSKDLDPKPYLGDGWQARTFEKFRGTYPEPLLLFYINHLGWELAGAEEAYVPAPAQGS
ncbi:MAG TPA: hypothetical protein VN442_21580 [Bryobacteraceae bacterium]|nr:hypothetical protein [Bryobacteraceae bacterium]